MSAITAAPVTIDFHGAAIPTFNVEGVVRVAMRPICEAIGLDWDSQRHRIRRHPVLKACAVMMTAQLPGDKQRRKLLTLPLNKLNGWLFGIDTSRVKPEIRETLIAYQAECFDVLADYWQKGEASNPRFTTIDERRPLNRAVRTLANLRSARGEAADYAGMWKLVNGYLGVAHIEQASPEQVEQGMGFVQEQIEIEARRVMEGDYLDHRTPASAARLEVPAHKAWHQYAAAELYGPDVGHHSRLGMMLAALKQAGAEEVPLAIGDISGAEQELLAYRHRLEMTENRLESFATNLHALAQHTANLEREFVTTVGPAIKPLNPKLHNSWRERLGTASRLAGGMAH